VSQDTNCVYILNETPRLEEKEKYFSRRWAFLLKEGFLGYRKQSGGGKLAHREQEME